MHITARSAILVSMYSVKNSCFVEFGRRNMVGETEKLVLEVPVLIYRGERWRDGVSCSMTASRVLLNMVRLMIRYTRFYVKMPRRIQRCVLF